MGSRLPVKISKPAKNETKRINSTFCFDILLSLWALVIARVTARARIEPLEKVRRIVSGKINLQTLSFRVLPSLSKTKG